MGTEECGQLLAALFGLFFADFHHVEDQTNDFVDLGGVDALLVGGFDVKIVSYDFFQVLFAEGFFYQFLTNVFGNFLESLFLQTFGLGLLGFKVLYAVQVSCEYPVYLFPRFYVLNYI